MMANGSPHSDLPVLEVWATIAQEFTVTPDDMDSFARLSGDNNPIHLDADFARARGQAGPVVYGGLLVAIISRMLGTRLPGPGCLWHSLNVKFKSVLSVGETAILSGRIDHWNSDLDVGRIRFTIMAGRRTIVDGEVQAQILKATP